MAAAGAVVARTLERLLTTVSPGMTTHDLDRIAEDSIRAQGATPSFNGYRGFPASLCTSINHEIVHGIPSARRVLKEGDVLSIDCGAILEGFHGDSAVTVVVGGEENAPAEVRELVADTRRALWEGLEAAQVGNRLGDVGHAVEQVARHKGYGVVREYVGHGIGRALHEDPAVPNYGSPGRGLRLGRGWVLALEPMFNLGSDAVEVLDDRWTVVTRDGALSAHFENTIAVTENGPQLLTAP